MTGSRTLMLRLYRGLSVVAGRPVYRRMAEKLRRAGVAEPRIAERLGHATETRPAGRLVWFHAASVGESLSVLSLIARMGTRHPDMEFLITSGTATSADLVARRMPPRTRHQFAPVDSPAAVAAFYDHWRPDAGIFVESEIWPNILLEAKARDIPLALLNARLSDKSVHGWRRWPDTARAVLDPFRILIAQNARSAENLRAMGAPADRVRQGTNLKAMSDPLPVDAAARAALEEALAGRPVWVASSTHAGEEEIVLAAHKRLLAAHPDLCLLLIPRHPERGDAVAGLIDDAGLSHARRSAGALPATGHAVYLADTLGETGLFYALAPIVFMAGSLSPIGGHNPFEPAQAGAAILTGPHRASFEESYAALIATGGAVEVGNATALADGVGRWLADPAALETAQAAARGFVEGQSRALERIVEMLDDALGLADA